MLRKYVLSLGLLGLCFAEVTRLENIVKIYSKLDWKRAPHNEYALKDVTLDFASRGIHTFVGTSGSGKSTLLKLLSGLELPTSGTIRNHHNDLSSRSAYLNQHFYMTYAPSLSLKDIKYSLPFNRRSIFADAFDMFEIPCTSPAVSLMESDRRMFEIILALSRIDAIDMPILCLDEWMDKDFRTTHKKLSSFLSVICNHPDLNLQVFIATHSKNVVRQFSDNVLALNKGRVFYECKHYVNESLLPAQLLSNMIE